MYAHTFNSRQKYFNILALSTSNIQQFAQVLSAFSCRFFLRSSHTIPLLFLLAVGVCAAFRILAGPNGNRELLTTSTPGRCRVLPLSCALRPATGSVAVALPSCQRQTGRPPAWTPIESFNFMGRTDKWALFICSLWPIKNSLENTLAYVQKTERTTTTLRNWY